MQHADGGAGRRLDCRDIGLNLDPKTQTQTLRVRVRVGAAVKVRTGTFGEVPAFVRSLWTKSKVSMVVGSSPSLPCGALPCGGMPCGVVSFGALFSRCVRGLLST